MILCVGNYGLGAYGMDSVHNRAPEPSRVTIYIIQSLQAGTLALAPPGERHGTLR